MPDVAISYKGSQIATMDSSGTKTLNTQGKYCEGNITVQYSKPSGQLDCQIIDFTLATHQSTDVTIGTLSDEAYAHIDDDNFCVAMINTTPESIATSDDDFRILVSNNPNNPKQGSYPIYGCGNRKTGATLVQNQYCYYPPNSTDNLTGIGGIGKIWHNGKTLYYKSASYFLAAGTYRVVITW